MSTRSIRAVIAAMLLTLLLTAPVAAVKPAGGCPNVDFDAMTLEAFIALELSVGLPPEDVPFFVAAFPVIDHNGDGLLCIKDWPDTPGHHGAILFNAVDNTSHSN